MKKTPIYERHIKLSARMVLFHGWLMPMQYKGIIAEHLAVRNNAGIFDVCHMGEFEIKGKDAYNFVQFLVTNNLDKIKPGMALYTPMCNENAGIIDDLIVYLFSKEHIMLVVNASNIEKDLQWIKDKARSNPPTLLPTGQRNRGTNKVKIDDISSRTALLAVQGPESVLVMRKFIGSEIDSLKRFHFIKKNSILISRTGYTGSDGFELFIDIERGLWLWDELMKFDLFPVGLGARDTLRLEKGYILYGNDADESRTPIEAGISWAVDFGKPDFIGKNAMLNKKPKRKLMFIELKEKGIPRQGCKIKDSFGKKEIGEVTSGTFSPSLQKGIALGYVDIGYEDVTIEIRGQLLKGRVYEHTSKSKVYKNT